MRRYSQDEEERVRAQAQVREWTRSGLLDPAQGTRLDAELRVDLRRTNVFLRAGLALFAGPIVAASVLFVIVGLHLQREMPIATVTGLSALVCFGLADVLVAELRLYRFGVEEALAVAAVALLSLSGAVLTSTFRVLNPGEPAVVVGLIVAAVGGFGIYRRFGFVYAAIGAMVCAAKAPFQLELPYQAQLVLAASVYASVFFVVRPKRLRYQDDYPGDEYGLLQAAALAGLYLELNLYLADLVFSVPRFFLDGIPRYAPDWFFYWGTYVMTWVLPVVGLRLGIRGKDRPLIAVSLAIALLTLVTNKPYLHWPRHEWDPILLGVFLMAVALIGRRWLLQGPNGQRGGFTPARLLSKESEILKLLSAASVTVQPNVPSPRPDPVDPGFDGGRSGGGGAAGTY